jgi:hypothetical protein
VKLTALAKTLWPPFGGIASPPVIPAGGGGHRRGKLTALVETLWPPFGSATGAPAPALPVNFFAALKAQFVASGLPATAPGGLFLKRAKAGVAPPFVLVDVQNLGSELITSTSQVDRAKVAFTAVATTLAAAQALALAVEAAYRDRGFAWSSGRCRPFRKQTTRPDEYGRLTAAGLPLYTWSVAFDTRVQGSA